MRKKTTAYTEQDYRPIILEEEVAKNITLIIHQRLGESFRHTSQAPYEKGRSTLEPRKMAVFFANHAIETGTNFYIYKRDKVNAFGSIDQDQIASSLHRMGIPAGAAQWFQRYVKQAVIASVTHYGTTRVWIMNKGIFQGDCLGPIVYIAQTDIYMQKALPRMKATQIKTTKGYQQRCCRAAWEGLISHPNPNPCCAKSSVVYRVWTVLREQCPPVPCSVPSLP